MRGLKRGRYKWKRIQERLISPRHGTGRDGDGSATNRQGRKDTITVGVPRRDVPCQHSTR